MVQETGDVNLIGIDVMDAARPWLQQGPSIASGLAQTAFGGMTSLRAAQVAAAASRANAQVSAGATVASAGIAGQSRVDSQLIATNGAIAENNARMKSDAAMAAAGDINAPGLNFSNQLADIVRVESAGNNHREPVRYFPG